MNYDAFFQVLSFSLTTSATYTMPEVQVVQSIQSMVVGGKGMVMAGRQPDRITRCQVGMQQCEWLTIFVFRSESSRLLTGPKTVLR